MDYDINLGDLINQVVGTGTRLIINNQIVKNAEAQANAQREALEKEYQILLKKQDTIRLMQQASQQTDNELPEKEKSNLPLYIGLGVGGVLVLGVIIFAVTRNKS
jgi:hypothetical protein